MYRASRRSGGPWIAPLGGDFGGTGRKKLPLCAKGRRNPITKRQPGQAKGKTTGRSRTDARNQYPHRREKRDAGSAPARLAGAVRNAAGAPMMADVPMVLLAGGIVLLVLPLAAVADIMTVDLGERGHRAAQNAAFASLRPSKALGASWVGGSRGRKAPCSGQLRRPVGIFDLSCATTLFHLACRVPQQRPRTPVTQQPRELNHGLPRFAAS